MIRVRLATPTASPSQAWGGRVRINDLSMAQVSEGLDDALFLLRPDGEILDASEAAVRRYGYSLEELRGMSVSDLRPEAERQWVTQQIGQASLARVVYDTTHRRKDGTCFPAQVSSAPVSIHGESAILGIVRDTSETKRVQDLADERRLLELTQASTHVGSWLMETQSGQVRYSDELFRLFAIDQSTPSERVADVIRSRVHPQDRELFESASRATLEGRAHPKIEYRVVRPDGSVRWVSGWAEIEPSSAQESKAFIGFVHDITATKTAEQQLRAREQAVRALFNAVTESAFLMRPDGEIITINDTTAQRISNVSGEELEGRCIYDLLPPALVASRRSHVDRVLETRSPVRFEDVRFGRVILNSISPVFVDGEITELAVFGYDITDVREAEAALRESERRLLDAQRMAKVGHFIFDMASRTWTASAHLQEMLGLEGSGDRAIDSWSDAVHPDDRAAFEAAARACVSGVAPLDIEYRVVGSADGELRWMHVVGEVERADDGSPLRIIGTAQDITAQQLSVLALRQERQRLEQVEAVGHVGSWMVNLRDGTASWSAELVRLVGFVPGEQLADALEQFNSRVHPEDRSMFTAKDLTAPWQGGVTSLDFRIMRPDGSVRWFASTGVVDRDPTGKPIAVRGAMQDITERKAAESQRVEKLEQEANMDRLTGLFNRRGFELLADQTIEQAKRLGLGVGIIYCDLDHLKEINDQFGHAQGDRAIHDVASVLKHALRSADVIARVGGDEFVVLSAVADAGALDLLVARLTSALELFNDTNERPYALSAATGVAFRAPDSRCGLRELEAQADAAMYAPKQASRP